MSWRTDSENNPYGIKREKFVEFGKTEVRETPVLLDSSKLNHNQRVYYSGEVVLESGEDNVGLPASEIPV